VSGFLFFSSNLKVFVVYVLD